MVRSHITSKALFLTSLNLYWTLIPSCKSTVLQGIQYHLPTRMDLINYSGLIWGKHLHSMNLTLLPLTIRECRHLMVLDHLNKGHMMDTASFGHFPSHMEQG